MTIWETLGVSATTNTSEIKKAYAKKLKQHHPESDPEGFQRLREAYVQALEQVKYENRYDKGEYERRALEDTDPAEAAESASETTPFQAFMKQVENLYADSSYKTDLNRWRMLLDSELLWNLENREQLSYQLMDFFRINYRLPSEVWRLLDQYFYWSEMEDSFSALVNNNLCNAVSYRDKEMVLRLLENGADKEAVNSRGMTPVIFAAMLGYLDIVKLLVHYGADIEARDHDQKTALLWAAENERIELLEFLMKNGANAEVRNQEGLTPLMQAAAAKGKLEIIKCLLANGALIDAALDNGNTALYFAIENERWEAVQYLLEQRADTNRLNLVCSSAIGLLDRVKYLLEEKGADMEERNKDGCPPLYMAVMNKHPETAEYLLKKGALPDISITCGWTPLIVAALQNDQEMMELLLNHGAGLEYGSGISKRTAFMFAADDKKYESMEYLLEKGANINAKDHSEETALIKEAFWGRPKLIQLLLTHGADISLKNHYGWDALLRAVAGDQPEIVKLLLEHGADIYTRDKWGKNLLLTAAAYGCNGMLDKLLEMGFSLDDTDYEGNTAFLLAVKNDIYETAEYIFKKTMNINRKNKNGKTALIIAVEGNQFSSERNQLKMVNYLLSMGADVNERDNQGKTALDYAKEQKLNKIVKAFQPAVN